MIIVYFDKSYKSTNRISQHMFVGPLRCQLMQFQLYTCTRVDQGKSGMYREGQPLPSICEVLSVATLMIFELLIETGVIFEIQHLPSTISSFLVLQSLFNFKSRCGVNRQSPGEIRNARGKSGITCIFNGTPNFDHCSFSSSCQSGVICQLDNYFTYILTQPCNIAQNFSFLHSFNKLEASLNPRMRNFVKYLRA